MENNSWLKLYRKLTEWGWYKDHKTKSVFIHLLLKCNYKPSEFMGYSIKPGQLVISQETISHQTNLGRRSVRTALEKLSRTGEITIEMIKIDQAKTQLISLVKWDDYNSKATRVRPDFDPSPTRDRPLPKNCLEVYKRGGELAHSINNKQDDAPSVLNGTMSEDGRRRFHNGRYETLVEAVFRDPATVIRNLRAKGFKFGSPGDDQDEIGEGESDEYINGEYANGVDDIKEVEFDESDEDWHRIVSTEEQDERYYENSNDKLDNKNEMGEQDE